MVSRQAVSKWESGRSVPDLDRIVTLSEVFGVATDYLLKDGRLGTTTPDEASGAGEGNQLDRAVAPDALTHAVSPREAEDFLAIKRKNGTLVCLGIALCIISPVMLLLLASLSEPQPLAPATGERAIGVGLIVLLGVVTVAVGIFLTMAWSITWVIWPVASIAYGIVAEVYKRRGNR